VYVALTSDAQHPLIVDSQSTAEALVLLSPLLIPQTRSEYPAIINAVKSNQLVGTLASIIDAVYSSAADPLLDPRIADAAKNAVISVLESLNSPGLAQQVSLVSRNMLNGTSPFAAWNIPSFLLPNTAEAALTGSPGCFLSSGLRMCSYDLGALTLKNSSGSRLVLEPDIVGPFGIKTNVNWVARIIELDRAKIQLVNNEFALFHPDDVESLALTGGYQERFVVQGAIASGWLGGVMDPLGKLADFIGGKILPQEGVSLPHDGVFAVVALSGSPFGNDLEYAAVRNSASQNPLWVEACAENILLAALDSVELATTFASAAAGAPDLSLFLEPQMALLRAAITENPGQVGVGFFVAKSAEVTDNLFDFLRPSIHAGVSNLGQASVKKFLHVAINTATSVIDVWSGSVSVSSRLLNFSFSVSPRESGYAILGTPALPPPPPSTVTLAVTKQGTGTGTVTSNLSGIGCDPVCQFGFTVGQQVVLSQVAGLGSTFAGWGGACTGIGACIVTMTANQNVTAAFNLVSPPPPSQETTVSINALPNRVGADGGTVTVSWNATNVDSCTITKNGSPWQPTLPADASNVVSGFDSDTIPMVTWPNTNGTTYTITCTNNAGASVIARAKVNGVTWFSIF
jgi:hypothetical protein